MVGALRADERSGASALARLTGAAILALLVLLLIETLFETWLLVVLADRTIGQSGLPELVLPAWPRGVRNAAYIALALLTLIHVISTGAYRRFVTPADIAFGLLAASLIVAGIAGGSSPRLIAEAVFVYLRAAILLYAIRALAPDWKTSRTVLWVLGAIVGLNAFLAVALAWVGPGGYQALGFIDLGWANLHRAQALQSHPNHLGHLVGLAMLGLIAWFATSAAVARRWWAFFGLLAVALALSQSRESLLGVMVGLAVIGVLARDQRRRLLGAFVLVVAVTGLSWTAQPQNWTELARRLQGVVSAVQVPSGEEGGVTCDPLTQDCGVDGIPRRENRILFYQQGMQLWLGSPLVGYGVGQFGGAVASQNDPQWYANPRFGPGGFDMHGLDAQQVDSFWLHLTVETGLIGTLAYLAWLALLALPTIIVARRGPTPSGGGPPVAEPEMTRITNRWAIGAITFGVVSAIFSPALEDPLFAPLLMSIIGLAWAMRTSPATVVRTSAAPAVPEPAAA